MFADQSMVPDVFHFSFSREEGPVAVGFSCVAARDVPLDCLSPAEGLRYDAFLSPARREGFINGRLAAKKALICLCDVGDLSDIEIYSGIMGQPLLRNARAHGFQLGISHTAHRAVAVAYPEAHPVAIDIEMFRPAAEKAIEKQLSLSERHLLDTLGLACGHTLFWSVRESLSKILKTGLMASAGFYEIKDIQACGTDIFELSFAHLFQYKAVCFVFDTYLVSICFPKKSTGQDWASLRDFFGRG